MAFPNYEQPVDHDAEAAEQAHIASEVEQPQVAGETADQPEAPAAAAPEDEAVVTVSLAADAQASNGEPLVELSVAGVVLTPGASEEVPRSLASVFEADDRVEVSA
jgi:hypothetical protein